MVSALFIDPKGPYPLLLGSQACWDIIRDARTYAGRDPVIAHPPCGRWCMMARMNERKYGAKVGDDGGCFQSALLNLYRVGGVLEHPAGSIAWGHFGLPKPNKSGWSFDGLFWVCEVWQSAYGHKAHKRTWLLYKGNKRPFELNWTKDKSLATHQIGGGIHTGNNKRPRLSAEETHISPIKFAEVLVKLAEYSR